ncbi:MAG TPA: GLUG motif-containing protein [Alcanivorax sp.]|nr:GLUG motif-containing protein [Alcanivorax sp.]
MRAVYEGRAVAVPVTAEVLFTGLGVSPESLVFGGSGGQATLQLFARYSDDSEQDVTDEATWASADTTVVTVDGSGTATPVGLGETSVTADYDGNEIDIPVTVAVTFSGGEGTETEPYAITTAEQLNGLRFYTGEGGEGTYFELMGDIDLSDPDFVDDASGWVPIGAASGEPFAANLDGNGFTLSNLSIDRPEQTDQGLFGRLSDATVTDLHLEAVSISAQSRVGALAGEILNTAIHGVTASGSVETQNTATSGSNAGGLIGTASGSEIVDSGTNVTITAVDHNIGGLVGQAFATDIRSSYSHGDVIGSGADAINIGGLVGYLRTGGRVEDSYATGSVNAIGSRNGGLIGVMSSGGAPVPAVQNSYAAGTVNAPNTGSSGGLIGSLDAGNIVDSFYTDGQFGEGAEKGMLITPTQLANESTFTNWDFITIWVMSGDHTRPVFLWEP